MSDIWRQRWLVIIAAPFLTSFLVRVYSWRILLQEEGWLASILRATQLLPDGSSLLYNQGAVVLVMIYTYLPLAILPIYAAMNRFDMSLYEAARDLGAGRWAAFFKVVLPNINRGIFAAALSVGVPSLGAYVIPEMIGGLGSETIGSVIAHKLFTDRNLPQAAVLASLLGLLALPLVMLAFRGERARAMVDS
ncbi:MAG: ABC transporter permease [Verrucomicrobiaceae bacterium]|nr:ABC transporter permease [Verrucomicrobiaceae bacterium]